VAYTILEPEVAGGWGANTVADVSVHPPAVTRLHYEFQGWLGDDLLESFPCFIVSERLAAELLRSELTGFTLDALKVSTSAEFEELHPGRRLPEFRWLRVAGRAGQDDFGIGPDYRLVVSAAALAVLEGFSLRHASREPHVARPKGQRGAKGPPA
jgi:hypothetical protein